MNKIIDDQNYTVIESDNDSIKNLQLSQSGITILPQRSSIEDIDMYNHTDIDFIKWTNIHTPSISIHHNDNKPKIILQSADIIMPLVYLAYDVSLNTYLNLVSDYLTFKLRGLLKNESKTVKIAVVSKSKKPGKEKRFEYEGDAKELKHLIKKIDLNKLMDD